MRRYILLVLLMISLQFIKLRGEYSKKDELDLSSVNYTTLWDILKRHENPFLQELNGFWTFNDTLDISKYEDFDHTRFDGAPQLSLEELLQEVKKEVAKRPRPQKPPLNPTKKPPQDLPKFDEDQLTNVTAQLGGTAYLTCRINNLNNRAVSWVRLRDWHILTSGLLTYTNDERFQVLHAEGSDEYTLQIKYVQKRDAGEYECQVSTGRGSVAHLYNLEVVVPTAYIVGNGEYHIGQGSTISLVCVIENSPTPPQYVMWYHNEKMINYEGSESPATVTTEPGERTVSKLVISKANWRHSGNYTCRASNTEPDYVYVFVSRDGDNIAAIQRQDSGSWTLSATCLLISVSSFLHLL